MTHHMATTVVQPMTGASMPPIDMPGMRASTRWGNSATVVMSSADMPMPAPRQT